MNIIAFTVEISDWLYVGMVSLIVNIDGDARTSWSHVMSNVFVPRTCLIEQITIFDACGD